MKTSKRLANYFSKRLFILAIISLIVLLISQTLGNYFWQAELFSHFVPYYALLLLLSALLKPINNININRSIRTIFILTALCLLIWCLPSYQGIKNWYQMPSPATRESLRKQEAFIAYQNVNISNKTKAEALTELTKYQPKILILLEAGGTWSQYLNVLKTEYPVHCSDDRASPFAMQVFTKIQGAECELVTLNELPMIKLTIDTQQVIYAIHPPPPINGQLAGQRLNYLHSVKALILQEPKDKKVMVIGDMNASGFSPVYRDFIEGTGLQATTAKGLPTWMPFFIGIDHYLVSYPKKISKNNDLVQTSDGISLTEVVQPIGWNGSDHRGFIIF